jgi:hypothetical protein
MPKSGYAHKQPYHRKGVEMKKRTMMGSLFLLVLFAATHAEGADTQPEYQQQPLLLNTADFVPAKLLKGTGYSVAAQAKNDGLVNIYSVTDADGAATVESTQALLIYIREHEALQDIEEIKKTDVYKEALKNNALGPYNTAKGLVTEPVDTVKKIGTGVGRWFSDMGSSVTSKDPNQAGLAKTALGQAAAKRDFACRLEVNPYSPNKTLQSKLDDLAWVAFAGGLTVSAAFSAIPNAAGTVVSMSGTSDSMKQMVRDKSPAELNKINKKALSDMGVTPQMADELLNNYAFDPYEKTLMIGALESMRGVKNRSVFIWNAFGVNNPSVAVFVRLQAECMAAYAAKHKDMAAMVDVCGKTFLKGKDNRMVGVFPLDYVAWTQRLDEKERLFSSAIEKLNGGKGKKLIVYGKIDPSARKMLEQRGWGVVEEKPVGAL